MKLLISAMRFSVTSVILAAMPSVSIAAMGHECRRRAGNCP